MQPLRATVAPFESVSVMPTAGQLTDSIKVTFQVRKREFTRRLVESFFAGFAGCAESEHARLDGLISLQPIVAADFEQARVALAVVEVPLESRGHGNDSRGLKHAGFLGKGIREPCGQNSRGTEKRIALFGDVRNRDNFAIAKADKALAQTHFGFVMRQ